MSIDRCQLQGLGFRDEVLAYLLDRNCSSRLHGQGSNLVSVSCPAQAHACGNILEVSGRRRAGGAPVSAGRPWPSPVASPGL